MNSSSLWPAVLARDASQDGRFVFAVKTTGIYCRPSCPAKRPKSQNVQFFPSPSAAEQAGFRPCKRCTPNPPNRRDELVRKICAYLEDRLEEPVTLENLSEEFGTSPFHLQRTFKDALGLSPREWAAARRLEKFKGDLRKAPSVTEALFKTHGSSRQAYENFPGMTPGEYRRQGGGLVIHYATAASPLGAILLAATDKGVCKVALGDTRAALEKELFEEFPAAEFHRDGKKLSPWIGKILASLRGKASPTLPLDLRATAFQRRVWEEARKIPAGETRTYSDIARRLGKKDSIRAVASALAKNPVALVIPCHRVVGKDGELRGYRWGLERKRKLLEREKKP
ncbi:MAG: bifunctional DNA-binding transcriptional regulator/O6-methylguanine-DNA methyltransferase Ada, partial [Bdellovibrionota bacterium]